MSDRVFNKAHEIWVTFKRGLREVSSDISCYATCLPKLFPLYIDLFRISMELQQKRFQLGKYISLNKEKKYDYSKDVDFNSMKETLDKISLHKKSIKKDISEILSEDSSK